MLSEKKMEILQVIFLQTSWILLFDPGIEGSIMPVTKCDGRERTGSVLNVDFMAMNQPCNCEVRPQFNGRLVFATNVILYDCHTNVIVKSAKQNDDVFYITCPKQHTSKVYSVSNSSVFEISSNYLTRTGDTTFYQAIQIFQDKSFVEPITVSCSLNEELVLPTTPITSMTSPEKPESSADGLIIGLVLCAILIAILIVVIVVIIFHFMRNQDRNSQEEKSGRTEPPITMTPVSFPQTSSYTGLVTEHVNNPTEHSYSGLQNESVYHEINTSEYERPVTMVGEDNGGLQEEGEVSYSNNVQQEGNTDL